MTERIDPLEGALSVTRALEALGVPHTIGGSIVSSFAGEPRSTVDIDIVAALDEARVDGLVSALSPEFYVDGDALRRAIRTRTSANLIHQGRGAACRIASGATSSRSSACRGRDWTATICAEMHHSSVWPTC